MIDNKAEPKEYGQFLPYGDLTINKDGVGECTLCRSYKTDKPIFWSLDSKFVSKVTLENIKFEAPQITIHKTQKCEFSNLVFTSPIHITMKSKVSFNNCAFMTNVECQDIVSVFGSSKATFTNCDFYNNKNRLVLVKDQSEAQFIDCKFGIGNGDTNTCYTIGVYALNLSQTLFERCVFRDGNRAAIWAAKKSSVCCFQCEFDNTKKGIVMQDESIGYVQKAKLQNLDLGIAISDDSKLALLDSESININGIHFFITKNSKGFVHNCTFANGDSNGVSYNESTGIVSNSKFENFKSPAIFTYGSKSNPVIVDVDISSDCGFGFAARDMSSPVLKGVRITTNGTIGVSISDFSDVLIMNSNNRKTNITTVGNHAISVYNGASVELDPQDGIHSDKANIKLFTNGKLISNEEYRKDYTYIPETPPTTKRIEQFLEKGIINIIYGAINLINVNKSLYDKIVINNPTEKLGFDNPEYILRTKRESNKVLEFDYHSIWRNDNSIVNRCIFPVLQNFYEPVIPGVLFSFSPFFKQIQKNNHKCFICGKTDCVITKALDQCGHMIMCDDCINNISSETEILCPLCQIKGKIIKPLEFETCPICLENPSDSFFVPCGHTTCFNCGQQQLATKRTCPLCNNPTASLKYRFNTSNEDNTICNTHL